MTECIDISLLHASEQDRTENPNHKQLQRSIKELTVLRQDSHHANSKLKY